MTVRQAGFQETNIANMVEPITKLAKKVNNTKVFSDSLVYACFISEQDRPSPILLDIPLYAQKAKAKKQVRTNLLVKMEVKPLQNKEKITS